MKHRYFYFDRNSYELLGPAQEEEFKIENVGYLIIFKVYENNSWTRKFPNEKWEDGNVRNYNLCVDNKVLYYDKIEEE